MCLSNRFLKLAGRESGILLGADIKRKSVMYDDNGRLLRRPRAPAGSFNKSPERFLEIGPIIGRK